MPRRLPHILVWLCVLLGTTLGGLSARAAAILKFRLTNQGTQSVSKVDFNVIPAGAIVPPVVGTDPYTGHPVEGSPLTILAGSTGFNADLLSVALGSKPGVQALRLLFGQTQTIDVEGNVTFTPILDADGAPAGEFGAGAVLNFSLTVDPGSVGPFQIQLPEMAAGLVIQDLPLDELGGSEPDPSDPTDQSSPTTPGGGASQIPEPLPLALWGFMTIAVLRRIHGQSVRRSA